MTEQEINDIKKSVSATELQDLTDKGVLVKVGSTGREITRQVNVRQLTEKRPKHPTHLVAHLHFSNRTKSCPSNCLKISMFLLYQLSCMSKI